MKITITVTIPDGSDPGEYLKRIVQSTPGVSSAEWQGVSAVETSQVRAVMSGHISVAPTSGTAESSVKRGALLQ